MKKNKKCVVLLLLIVSMLFAACGAKDGEGNGNEDSSTDGGQQDTTQNGDAAENDTADGSEDSEEPEVKDMTALEVADAIMAAFAAEELPEFSLKLSGTAEDHENYFIPELAGTLINGTPEAVAELEFAEDYAFYIPKGAKVFEIDVIKVGDAGNIEAVQEMLEKRRVLKDDGNVRLYNPEEVPLLDASRVVTIGNYVILLVTSDNDLAEETASQLLIVE